MAGVSMENLGLCSRLHQGISKMGISHLTPIQAKSWDALVSSKKCDHIIHSETGSGKTLSYLLPILQSIMKESEERRKRGREDDNGLSRKDGTSLLIIVPVRELAQQTLQVCQKLLRYVPFMTCSLLTGGEKKSKEKARLRKGQNILIATPGRLLDHIRSTEKMNLNGLKYLVIDEADRTLDEGFENDLRELKVHLDEKQAYFGSEIKKKVLVSATLNKKILGLSYFILENPKTISSHEQKDGKQLREGQKDPSFDSSVSVETGEKENTGAPIIFPAKLDQRYIICSPKRKVSLLIALLNWIFNHEVSEPKKVVVFANSFACIDFFTVLAPLLTNPYKKNKASSSEDKDEAKLFDQVVFNKIHKEMSQLDRSSSFSSFQKAPRSILFCTDVAARGLDFEGVSDVIHFDAPLSIETYIHRTGRTARIGNSGTSYLLLYPHEDGYPEFLESKGASITKKEPSVFFYTLIKHNSTQCDLFECQIELQKVLDATVRSDSEIHKMAQDAFHSWRKSYSAYPFEQRVYFDSTKLHLRNISWSFGIRS